MILWNIVSEMMISQVISEILGEKMILPQISQMLLLLHKFINLKDPGEKNSSWIRHEPDVLGRDHVPSKGGNVTDLSGQPP